MCDRPVLFVGLFLLLTGVALADDPGLTAGDAALPPEVSEAVAGVLQPQGFSVTLNGEPRAHIWLANETTPARNPSTELGVTRGDIQRGSLVGLVHFPVQWSDYKGSPIRPGFYTLRYDIMPADGAHMGVAQYRDFLILLSSSVDTDPSRIFTPAEMIDDGVDAIGIPHPGVLSLFPIWEEVPEPRMMKNEIGQWMLAVKIGGQAFGLVVEGHGAH